MILGSLVQIYNSLFGTKVVLAFAKIRSYFHYDKLNTVVFMLMTNQEAKNGQKAMQKLF